ncbi:MAG: Crp/Fnr family transcriptional regulator [Bacteroidetes bacterium]|nr:Crp/Fnr family transcriptional regulator [Bacteroidota bacterium]
MVNIDICDPNACFLCRHCLPEWKGVIASTREVVWYKKGQAIFREGEEVRGMFFINKGAVKVHQSWGEGKDFILRFAIGGSVLGHRGFGGGSTYPVTATALDNTSACFITGGFLDTLCNTNAPLVRAMMQLYASELQTAEKRMRDLAVNPVRVRVAEALSAIRDAVGIDEQGYINIPITRVEIAAYAGTTYEAVFRLLSEFSDQGLVSTAGKKFRIDKEEALDRYVRSDRTV